MQTDRQAGSLHVDRQTGWKPIPLFGAGWLQMGDLQAATSRNETKKTLETQGKQCFS
jgi:hypothetical protein